MERLINNLLNSTIGERFCEADFRSLIGEWEWGSDIPLDFYNGASKGVIVSPESSIVIKIPFECYFSLDDYDCSDEKELEQQDIYRKKDNAPTYTCAMVSIDDDSNWDYCDVEYRIYQEAARQGLEKYFAEVKFLGHSKDGHPIYSQEKCYYSYNLDAKERNSKYSENSYAIARNKRSEIHETSWIATFIEMNGEEEFDKLNRFLMNLDYINDLHFGNIGFGIDGRPLLIDYSGFND